jgi:ABC-type multidrug transport system ATPase subunit
MAGGLFVPKISGGERRRTSIGLELITNPKIFLLDEPTSGLDSYNAIKIIRLLKREA